MSVNRGSMARIPQAFEMDGSDGAVPAQKTQADHVDDVKAYLGATRTVLRNMTWATLEDLLSDSSVDPAYINCVRELLRLGGGVDSKEEITTYRKGSSIQSAEVNDVVKDMVPKRTISDTQTLSTIGKQLPASPLPHCLFTMHFLPQAEPFTPNSFRPPISSVLVQLSCRAGSSRRAARELYSTRFHCTSRGDLVLSVSDNFRIPEDLLTIDKFPVWLKTFLHLPQIPKIRYRRQGTVLRFLRIQGIPEYRVAMGDWSRIRPAFPTDSSLSPNPGYGLPPGFRVHGESVSVGGSEWDAYVDLTGLGNVDIKRLKCTCDAGSAFALAGWPKTSQGWSGQFYPTSFLELKDEE